MRRLVAVGTMVILATWPATGAEEKAKGEKGIPPEGISLVEGSVFEVYTPPPVSWNEAYPGEAPLQDPAHPEMPPVIPHGVQDFLPLELDANFCVGCHGIEEAEEGDPTPIPESHYVDNRNAPEKTKEEIVGSRYYCLSCHVAQSEAEPLVENEFDPVKAGPPSEKASEEIPWQLRMPLACFGHSGG
ncbi:MAG: nitrate reductase cytochrome c-type subunit [Thermoanaerobaculia bacterium]|nr:nitrate reductase cytochrome c-type subunit [Thermoanaerobaculia bacterium]